MFARRIGVINDSTWSVDLVDGVFADEDGDVLVAGLLLPVVPVIEALEEERGFLVMVSIPHTALGYINGVVETLAERFIVCC